ncbi:MAG: glycosyltransferase family 2 protein [Bacteroidetes bacterium]|nr:glycosyltransferase family 2 protein [Bacteroidota bacterium]MBT5528351.1 glycosyltransferase family 2 protein [Cytophagia bacterium]MBT3421681.1 glycosyltransferase family 2 protein [Bacteroidota bacterium]MBT3802534.1 glycosyltransferase family 2 protein [Bacteroidota bacterium]MBT3933610.1 glycosyltransferase family 2 protein [Bacteroidota bacterium]
MDISLVIPLLNEEESLTELTEWIERVMTEHKFSYEVIFIDDGSTDQSLSIIKTLSKNNAAIKGLSFRRNYGKSAALNEGFRLSKGDVVITMDSDLQDSPEEIPELFKMIKTDGYDIVSGWKKKRFDPISKTIPTKLYNWATRRLTGIKLHDFNCGLKAYKSEVVKSINVYGEMHRYIPVLAKWQGFSKIGEKVVLHQARKYGETKFGLERFIRGPLDLLSIMFVSKFSKRPMHFFGSLGILSFLAGFIITVWLISEKFYARFVDSYEGRDIIEKPLFFIALLMLMIGVVLFLAGFIGELISKITDSKSTSVIKERININ